MTEKPFAFRQRPRRAGTGFDWRRVFARLRFAHPEPALREIADHLHAVANGDCRADPEVLALLAQMLDPDEIRPAARVKLDLRRLQRKAPPVVPNYELRLFLEDRIDGRGEPVEAVVAAAAARFGASRSQCLRQLKVVRHYRKSMAELDEMLAKIPPQKS